MEEETLEFLRERYQLSLEKIQNIAAEDYGDASIRSYFVEVADFLCRMNAFYEFVEKCGWREASAEERKNWCDRLCRETGPDNYGNSYANPVYAQEMLGMKFGRLLSALYAEVRCAAEAAEQRLEEVLIRLELFVEVYSAFEYEWQEEQVWPAYESIRQIVYWYVSDYSDITAEAEVERLLRTVADESSEKGADVRADACGCCEYSVGLLQGIVPVREEDTVFAETYMDGQYVRDHRDDKTLLWDKAMVKRRLEVLRTALEKHREQFPLEQKSLFEDCCRKAEAAERQYLRNC